MDITSIGRIALIATLLIYILVYAYRAYKKADEINQAVVIKLIGFALLAFLPTTTRLLRIDMDWAIAIALSCRHVAAAFAYLAFEQMLLRKEYLPILSSTIFKAAIISTIIMGVLFVFDDNVAMSFSDNDMFNVTWVYFLRNVIYSGFQLIVGTLIVRLYWIAINQPSSIAKRIHNTLAITFFTLGTLSVFINLSNLTISFLITDVYKAEINGIYHGMKIFFVAPMILSVLVPPIYNRVAQPIKEYHNKIHNGKLVYISYLYSKVTSVVPDVKLNTGILHMEDMLIEIADALAVILSHHQYNQWPTAEATAKIISETIIKGDKLEPGPYVIPPMKYNEVSFNIAVSKHLMKILPQT